MSLFEHSFKGEKHGNFISRIFSGIVINHYD